MEAIKLNVLIDRCVRFFEANCYTVGRINRYKSLWRNGIVKFMDEKGTEMYTTDIGADFKETCVYEGMVRPQERDKIRSIQVLDDMMSLGTIRKRCLIPVEHALYGEIGAAMERLIGHLGALRRSQTTLSSYRLYLSEFLVHLNDKGISRLNQITDTHILSFVSAHPTNKVNIVSALRVLFRFWEDNKILEGRFMELFDTYKIRRPDPVPSFYSDEEVRRLEASISRSCPTGKRDFAMTLLASRLGLRASDIANLKLDDIDWEANVIRLVMVKTEKPIELPLLADVGNAIIDYLRFGRPATTLPNVFLSSRAPYCAANKGMVCSAISRIICKSGVVVTEKRHGPHSLRHSMATSMLNAGRPLPSISEALGHRSTQTTLKYIKIDMPSLRTCALDVPDVPESFYEQRGGAFYG